MNAEQLRAYFQARAPGATDVAVSGLARLSVGTSRETWRFDTHRVEAGEMVEQHMILRRDADGGPIDIDLKLEFEVYQSLQGSPVPVPRSFWYEGDRQWVGKPFFLMERIDGCETNQQVLLFSDEWAPTRPRLGRRFVEIFAELHNLDWEAAGFGRFMDVPTPESAATRELRYWEETLDRVEMEPQPLLRGMFAWLRQHLPPPPARIAVVHGDYRTGNYLATNDGDIRGFLDWELAHLGDPLEDVGWTFLNAWAFGGGQKISGLVERSEFLRQWSGLTGIPVDPEALRFWEVFNNVKGAIILLTGGRSFCDGRTRNMMMLSMGRGAHRFSLEALRCSGLIEGGR